MTRFDDNYLSIAYATIRFYDTLLQKGWSELDEARKIISKLDAERGSRTSRATEANVARSIRWAERARLLKSERGLSNAQIAVRLTEERNRAGATAGRPQRRPFDVRTVERYLAGKILPTRRRSVRPDDEPPE